MIHTIQQVSVPANIKICRDPDDDKVIAAAVTGEVEYLLTQDKDLLTGQVQAVLNRSGITVTVLDDLIRLLDFAS